MNSNNVDEKLIEKWEDAYTNGELPERYEFDGQIKAGRPTMFDGEMTTLTVLECLLLKRQLWSVMQRVQDNNCQTILGIC
jgi:hypothetical protein